MGLLRNGYGDKAFDAYYDAEPGVQKELLNERKHFFNKADTTVEALEKALASVKKQLDAALADPEMPLVPVAEAMLSDLHWCLWHSGSHELVRVAAHSDIVKEVTTGEMRVHVQSYLARKVYEH